MKHSKKQYTNSGLGPEYMTYVPTRCIIMKIDGSYDARNIREDIRVNANTRELAWAKLSEAEKEVRLCKN